MRSVLLMAVCLLPLAARGEAPSMSLSEALGAALDNDPAVKASEYRRAAARARIRDARSGSRPQLSATVGYTRHQEPNTVVPIHVPGVFPPLDNDIHHASLQARLSLFDGGRRAARHRAARAGAEEAGAQSEAATISLIEDVGAVFVRGRDLADRHDLIGRHLASLEHRWREVGHLLSEGRVAPADVAMVEAALEEARADRAKIEGEQHQLAIRLGWMVSATGPVAPWLRDAGARADEEEAAVAPLPAGDAPQVASARARWRQMEAVREQARGAAWPEVSSFATYSVRSGDDLDGFGEWLAGVQLSLPLFDGGHRSAAMAAAQAAAHAAREQVRLAQQQQAMAEALAAQQWQSAQARRQHIAAAVTSKARSLAAHHEMYREGRISMSDLMVQETAHLQLQMRERSLAYEQSLALLRQHAVAGTLTPNNVEGMVWSSL